jgi:hypothetical protein
MVLLVRLLHRDSFDIAVKDSLITGWFRIQVAFGGTANQSSKEGEITGEVNSDGAAFIEQREPRNSQFSGTFPPRRSKQSILRLETWDVPTS